MELAKLGFCSVLAFGSLSVYRLASGRPWETAFYRKSVWLAIGVKFASCLILYLFFPNLVTASDALTYFEQVQWFLQGQVVYFDINTAYSLLFLPFLSLPVRLWHSVGAIVLTMVVLETAMLLMYLYHYGKKNNLVAWRVGFLYSFSPISFYWVALTGYNGIIIAAFTMLALVLTDRGKHALAGLAGSMGFLLSKLLAVLAWPAIVFYDRIGWLRRSTFLLWPLLPLPLLALFKINPLRFLGDAFQSFTSGNVWFLVTQVLPGFRDTFAWTIAPVVSFNLFFWPLFVAFLYRPSADGDRFDRAIALVSSNNLLFMIFSRKSYTFYMPMAWVFVIHSIVGAGHRTRKRLIPLAVLGATTTAEVALFQSIRRGDMSVTGSIPAALLFVVDVGTIVCYVYLLIVSARAALGLEADTRCHEPPEEA